jgi:hypothetical protein
MTANWRLHRWSGVRPHKITGSRTLAVSSSRARANRAAGYERSKLTDTLLAGDETQTRSAPHHL